MKVIALLPVRNEAWVLEHSLSCLSAFCDVVIVSDQGSTDGSQEICRRFPKVHLLETPRGQTTDLLPKHARWRLLDAARQYDGNNLLWCTDADELISPASVRTFLAAHAGELIAPRAIQCRYIHLWKRMRRFRHDLSPYGPKWKVVAVVDDRRMDYPRDPGAPPLHEPRTPMDIDPHVLSAGDLHLLHLQYAAWQRNQMKQAWYRSLEQLDGRATAAEINEKYGITMSPFFSRTKPVPPAWLDGLTLPSERVDDEPGWHDAEMLRLFDERGIEFFEPLQIWHLRRLRDEFRRRTGRDPRSDRSHIAPMSKRVSRFGRRILAAVRRQVAR